MPVKPAYDGVLFDLLTALLDSWTLWNDIAGSEEQGLRWRRSYLSITYGADSYQPYEALVAEAAESVGLPRSHADELDRRYAELAPWPGVTETLRSLHEAGIPLGVVTNCSERLGRIAAERIGVPLRTLVTAERAGFYKPNPVPYRIGLAELGVPVERCLFVAGSANDLFGTGAVGLATYWHNRSSLPLPDSAPPPLQQQTTIEPLLTLLNIRTA